MKEEKRKYTIETVNKWSDYLKDNHTLKETSEFFNISYYSLVKILTRYGYRRTSRTVKNVSWKKNVNTNYFEKIDSYEKAYFLGFIYADGSISSNSNTNQKVFSFVLQLQDRYILENLHKKMNLKTKISIYKNSAKLHVYDSKLYNDLNNLGVYEDKSHKDFSIPSIDKKYLSSFILGYFDGDGCITIKQNKTCGGVNITCNSNVFLKEIQNILNNQNIKNYIKKINKPTGYLYVLYISGKENQIKFRDYIYKDYNNSLIRKKEKFYQIV